MDPRYWEWSPEREAASDARARRNSLDYKDRHDDFLDTPTEGHPHEVTKEYRDATTTDVEGPQDGAGK